MRLREKKWSDQQQSQTEEPVDRPAIENFLFRDCGLAIEEAPDVEQIAPRRPPTRTVPGPAAVMRPDDEIFESPDRVGRHLERRVPAPGIARIGHLNRGSFGIAGGR